MLGVWCPASQPPRSDRCLEARFGSWREDTLGRAGSMFDLAVQFAALCVG